jgi:hypothetical protein
MKKMLLMTGVVLMAGCGPSQPKDTVESLVAHPDRLRESLLRHLLLTWFLFGCEAARPNAAPRPTEGKHHADSLPPLRLYPSTQQRDHAAAAVSAAARISSMDCRRQHGGSSGHRTCPKRAAGSAACCYQHFAHDTARSTGQPSGRHSPSAQKRQIDSA